MTKLIELTSPFAEWPGSLWIPEVIDAADFNTWWERFMEIEEKIEDGVDKRHDVFTAWESRFHLIKRSTLQLGSNHKDVAYELEATGLKLPSNRIAQWFIRETDPYLELEINLKNSPGASTTTSSTTAG